MAVSKADAPFVFEGSVKSLSASNVASVPADERTVLVQVDHVRHAPRALAGFAGKDVTVRMAPNESLAAGEKAVFFADGLVFADHLAVQSVGHDPIVAMEARAALAGAGPVVQKLRRRLDEAQSVVTGRVTSVRPPASPAMRAMAAAAPGSPAGRISEHAPFWNEAVINVSTVHKGPKQKQVVVRFPTSTDVRWRSAPRFRKGQTGTWLLHTSAPAPAGAKRPGLKAMAAIAPAGSGIYTALDPNDFQPTAEAAVIKAMVPAAPGLKAAKAAPMKRAAVKKAAAGRKARSVKRAAKAKTSNNRKTRSRRPARRAPRRRS